MRLSDFDYELPEELIAQHPAEGGREQSRLLALNRQNCAIEHRQFFELPSLLQDGDVLVLNNSKVFPARLFGTKIPSGGKVELLLTRKLSENTWESMVRGKQMKPGTRIQCSKQLTATLKEKISNITWSVEFSLSGAELRAELDLVGNIPIPPYISSSLSETELRSAYQTVYAQQEGSVAAPTAGLHFSQELLAELVHRGVKVAYVTLHVGLGTFAPVRTEHISEHTMHSEFALVSEETADIVNRAKKEGQRIIAVGTTSVRTLESCMHNGELHAGERWTDIFITPGFQFQCVDGMITNFHLPKSTLLMLVSAFTGVDCIRNAYAEAIRERYRFYSFGDAMFIE